MLSRSCRLLHSAFTQCRHLPITTRSITRISQSNVSLFFYRSIATRTNKIVSSVSEAFDSIDMKDGQTVLVGGFGVCGIPMGCIQEVKNRGYKDLVVVSNDCGVENWGLGVLLPSRQMRRIVASYVGENAEIERQYFNGEIEVELMPQGTLAEALRCGGAGIPAFFTRSGAGTIVETGGLPIKYTKPTSGSNSLIVDIASPKKETRIFKGRSYIMETSIQGDIGLIKAWKADSYGNLIFKGTARNFNPECAMAAKQVIAEVDEIVPLGSIPPADVHLPGCYVTAVVQTDIEKRIERPKFAKPSTTIIRPTLSDMDIRERIARRAALEIENGMNVNLGIGMPTMTSNYLPAGVKVMYQSENGLLGMGPYPIKGTHDPDLVNAGKETTTTVAGASIFSSGASFDMIRGKHLDISILGAMEVSVTGDLANWIIPGKLLKGMGGAMDLVSSGSRIVVVMSHTNKNGKSKIVKQCSLPLTGVHCVNRIITELAVFDIIDRIHGLQLIEIAEGVTIDEIKAKTDCEFTISPTLKTIEYA